MSCIGKKEMKAASQRGVGVSAGCDVGDPETFALCRSGSDVLTEQRAGRDRSR